MDDSGMKYIKWGVVSAIGFFLVIFLLVAIVSMLSAPIMQAKAHCDSLNGTYGGGKCYVDGVEKDAYN